MKGKFYNDETVTTTTLVANTWTKLSDAVGASTTNMRELYNETGAVINFVYNNTAPTGTDTSTSRQLADATGYITNRSTGMSCSALYAFSVGGGDVKYVEA